MRGLRRSSPGIDLLRIHDAGLRTFHDLLILDFAAEHVRVLLTSDIRTIHSYAYGRIARELRMPGVILVPQSYQIRTAIEEISLIAELLEPNDLINTVRRLPFI